MELLKVLKTSLGMGHVWWLVHDQWWFQSSWKIFLYSQIGSFPQGLRWKLKNETPTLEIKNSRFRSKADGCQRYQFPDWVDQPSIVNDAKATLNHYSFDWCKIIHLISCVRDLRKGIKDCKCQQWCILLRITQETWVPWGCWFTCTTNELNELLKTLDVKSMKFYRTKIQDLIKQDFWIFIPTPWKHSMLIHFEGVHIL